MATHKYYDLSSDNDSYGNSDSSGSSSEDDYDDVYHDGSASISGQDPLWGRTILHLDIDCFYVQAEEIERGLRSSGKPCADEELWIGQSTLSQRQNK